MDCDGPPLGQSRVALAEPSQSGGWAANWSSRADEEPPSAGLGSLCNQARFERTASAAGCTSEGTSVMLMGRGLILCAVFLVLTGAVGCVSSVKHSPDEAASVATDFASTLIVEQDATSRSMTDRESRPEGFDAARLRGIAERTPRYGEITEIVAIEFEPVIGESAIDIFLEGLSPAGRVYYRVRILGTMEKGYRPAAFVASDTPFAQDSTGRQPF